MVWLLEHTRKFPKYQRFRLAKQIDDAIFAFHECLIRAAQTQNPHQYLREADIQLDLLRAYLRLAVELKYTSRDQYGHAARHTTEIGRLLGGWLKAINPPQRDE